MRQAATRTLDQRLVNWLEQHAVGKLLQEYGLRGGLLLDAPCGYGRFWPTFSALDLRYFGIDLDPQMVRLADRRQRSQPERRALCADVFRLPFADDTFDCVVSIRLLHLAFTDRQREQIIRELVRTSRRFLLLSLYRSTPLHSLARRWNSTPGRVRLMTDTQLQGLITACDVELEQLRPLQRFFHMQTFALLSKKVDSN